MLRDTTNNINGADSSGDTSLIVAAWYGYSNIVQKLIDLGADLNIRNKQGFTALMMAVYAGNNRIVRLLLNNKAFYNSKKIRKMYGFNNLSKVLKRRMQKKSNQINR